MILKRRLIDFFDEAHYLPVLQSSTKSEVIEELLQPLIRSGTLRDREIVLDMLIRREQLGSTGIGKGIAIPHGRSVAVPDLQVVFGRSEKGVDFDAEDGKPATLFFLIVAPPQDKQSNYLPLLGKIVELVKDKKSRDRLHKATSFDDIRQLIQEVDRSG
jgi:mannitol/fructose-specific phosphotransferase system IIA component (Ntr-type)